MTRPEEKTDYGDLSPIEVLAERWRQYQVRAQRAGGNDASSSSPTPHTSEAAENEPEGSPPEYPTKRPLRTRPSRQQWEVALRLVSVEQTEARGERTLALLLGLPQRTLMSTIHELESLGLVYVEPGQEGLPPDSRYSHISWSTTTLHTWLQGGNQADTAVRGQFPHDTSVSSFCNAAPSIGRTTIESQGHAGNNPGRCADCARFSWRQGNLYFGDARVPDGFSLAQPRWASHALGVLGWQVTVASLDWDGPFGIRDMARAISRRWEYGADHKGIARCLVKMQRDLENDRQYAIRSVTQDDTTKRWSIALEGIGTVEQRDATHELVSDVCNHYKYLLLRRGAVSVDALAERNVERVIAERRRHHAAAATPPDIRRQYLSRHGVYLYCPNGTGFIRRRVVPEGRFLKGDALEGLLAKLDAQTGGWFGP